MKKLFIFTFAIFLSTFFAQAQVLPDIVGHSIKPTYTYDASTGKSSIDLTAFIRVKDANVGTYRPAVYISNEPDKIGDFLGYLYVASQNANTVKAVENGYTFRADGDVDGKYIVIRVDGQNQITESDETNNIYSKQIKKVDLRATSVSGSHDGSTLSVSTYIRANFGTAIATKAAVYVASEGGKLDDFVGFIDVPAFTSPNTSVRVTKSFPYSKPAAGKYITIRVDAWNQVAESNEDNNKNWGSIYIFNSRTTQATSSLPDIEGHSIKPCYTYDSNTNTSHIDLTAFIRVRNANVGTYHPAVYLSDEPNTIGKFLGYLYVASQNANTVKAVENGYTFKASGDVDGKYIVIRVDGQNQITESDETNNVYSKQIKKVDLRATSVSGSHDGSTLSVSVYVRANFGKAIATKLAVYVASQGGGLDDFVGFISVPAFDKPNTSVRVTGSFPYSKSVVGKYITVRVDAWNQVEESDETNNKNWGSIYTFNFRNTKTSVENNNGLVHPNPAINVIKLQLTKASPVVIYDFKGQIVAQEKSNAGLYTKDISNLKPGRYFIKTNAGSQTFIKK